MDFIFYELLEENSTASSWNIKSVRQRKVFVWEKTSPFDEIRMTAFTIGFPIGIHRTLFFDIGNFEKQQEKSGFPSRNQKYVVYLILNNLWRLVCTGQMVRGTNFISGSPPLISSAKSLNSVTLTVVSVTEFKVRWRRPVAKVGAGDPEMKLVLQTVGPV